MPELTANDHVRRAGEFTSGTPSALIVLRNDYGQKRDAQGDERARGYVAMPERLGLIAMRPVTAAVEAEQRERLARSPGAPLGLNEERSLRAYAAHRLLLFEGGSRMSLDATGRWATRTGREAGPRLPDDPLWILDALSGSKDARHIGDEPVRGELCAVYETRLDLELARTRSPHGLDLRVGRVWHLLDARSRRWAEAVPATVCIGADEVIRRARFASPPVHLALARRVRERRGTAWESIEFSELGRAPSPSAAVPGDELQDQTLVAALRAGTD